MKKIMILSSKYTGHGHASLAQSITEQLDHYDDVCYEVVDGFSLFGKAGIQISKFYGPITRYAGSRELYKHTYALFDQHPRALLDLMSVAIHDRFVKVLSGFMPDLILTVHPFFNGTVIDILEFYRLDIPVYALQADLINIHGAWCDPRAALTFCPTPEAYASSIARGMPADRLVVTGFPSRAQFTEAALSQDPPVYDDTRPLNCLLMSGGEGSGNMQKYARQLLAHVNCNLSIICGRNVKLKTTLEEALLPQYWERVRIFGFMDNVHELMQKNDLVIARGSPNTMMEAVVLGVPLIITGSLPGQEADNPALMVSHNLGVVCDNPESIHSIVHALMKDNGKRLKEIGEAQRGYRDLTIAANVAAMLHTAAISRDRPMPNKRIMLFSRHGGRRSMQAQMEKLKRHESEKKPF